MTSENHSERWPRFVRARHALGKVKYSNPDRVVFKGFSGSEEVGAKDVIDWIYSVLTTLDAKASALMRLNGILIAASAFMLGQFGAGHTIMLTERTDALLIISLAILSAISIMLCLIVVNVSWPFLGKVKIQPGDPNFDFTEEIRCLGKTSELRQIVYCWAWYISLFSSIGFLWEFFRQACHIFRHYSV